VACDCVRECVASMRECERWAYVYGCSFSARGDLCVWCIMCHACAVVGRDCVRCDLYAVCMAVGVVVWCAVLEATVSVRRERGHWRRVWAV
jgi:hypothetical protein